MVSCRERSYLLIHTFADAVPRAYRLRTIGWPYTRDKRHIRSVRLRSRRMKNGDTAYNLPSATPTQHTTVFVRDYNYCWTPAHAPRACYRRARI